MAVKSKKRTISIVCLCLLFVLTTALGLGTLSPVRVFADDSSASAVHALKFKQVAAGEDFMIALTYDGDLYGMSLLPKKNSSGNPINGGNEKGYNTNPVNSLNTLGEYYPSTPIKIDVKFTDIWYSGTKENPSGISIGEDHNTEPTNSRQRFDESEANRTIKSIVATRKTAAFITENNLIYTWGQDIAEPTKGETTRYMNLLLRDAPASESNYKQQASKFEPSMINYLSTTNESVPTLAGTTTALLPFEKKYLANVYAFTASEYNYNLFYSPGQEYDGNNGKCRNFTWGQQVYYQLSNGEYEFNPGNSSVMSAIVQTLSGELETQAFLGDGNVYYFSGGKLYARGKNFSVTSATIGYDSSNTVNSGIVNTLSDSSGINPALLRTEGGSVANTGYKKISAAMIGFTKVSEYAPTLKTNNVFNTSTTAFYDSQGNVKKLKDSQGNDKDIELTLPQFAAGAGYGYLIDDNSKVKGWGRIGNLTGATLPLPTGTSTTYSQVVAGKILTGLPVINGIENTDNDRIIDKETYEGGKWKTAGVYTELKDEFVDGNTELSAALNGSGQIEVFGVYDGTALNKTVSVPNAKSGNTNNKFAAIFGGYGNNLFAISNIGKLYRITAKNATTLDVTPIDEFTTSNGSPIKNWSIETTGENAPVITFADEYQTRNAEGKWVSNYTASVSLSGVTTTKAEDIKEDKVTVEKNGKVIGDNYSDDAYRMVLPNGQNAENSLLSLPSGLSLSADSTQPTYITANYADFGKMLFRWDGDWDNDKVENIPLDVALQYVNIAYTYDSNTQDIGFTITPKKSTQGKTLHIKYWVGRYDTTANFNGNEVFYDFKQAEVCVKIGDTPRTVHYTSAIKPSVGADDTSANLNSRVPLLDPNNPYNNTYSIAAMNVSGGFDAVFTLMAKSGFLGGASFSKDAALADIYEALSGLQASGSPASGKTALDSGFPANAKIEAGSLLYYNEKANDFYKNTYEYFVDDIDGDVLKVSQYAKTAKYYEAVEKTITVPYTLNTSGWGADNAAKAAVLKKLENYFTKNTRNADMPYFANTYGITIAFDGWDADDPEQVKDTVTMTFTYSVLTITATTSMPDTLSQNQTAILKYTNDDVSKPDTTIPTQTLSGAGITVSVKKDGGIEYPVSAGQATRAFVDVFTQSSLIFKADTNVIGATSDYLTGGKSNVYESAEKFPAVSTGTQLALTLATDGKDEITVPFGNLFKDLGGISVAYEGDKSDTAYKKLQSTFGDGEDAYTLSKVTNSSITIKAKKATLTDTEYSFTIQLRRFYGGNANSKKLVKGENDAEVAYVRFTVTVSAPSGNFMQAISTATKDIGSIVEKTTKPLSERINLGADSDYVLGALYDKGELKIDVTSSDPSIVTAEFNKDGKGIVLTPYTSGTAFIYYTITLYSYTLKDSFKVTVNTLATLEKTVNVITDEKIYFSDLRTYLQTANSIATDMTLTPRFGNTPFYFEETDDVSDSSDAEKEWTKLDSYPAFLEEPYIDQTEDKAYFGLRMGQYDPDQLDLDNKLTRCVVVFVSGDGKEYRVAFKVAPGAQTAKDNSRTLLIGIDKANKTISVLSSENQDTSIVCTGDTYVIPVAFLAKKIHNYDRALQYEIIAAQAVSANGSTNYTKYLDVAMNANEVILTPKYPTAELKNMDGCNLQVSLKNKNSQVVTLLNFTVSVTGIKTVLSKSEYTTLILATFFAVLALLLIIFFIRLAVYWKKKAEQRKIIRKNQMLIRMRDKMHNKTEAVSKEKLVRTKLKMEDPKYAKMFTEMRQNKEEQTGITLENSTVAQKAENRVKAEKASKKHKGKKSIDELKAELEAKRAAFASMQAGEVPEGGIPVDGMQMDQSIMDDSPVFTDAVYNDGLSGEDIDAQIKTHISSEDIVFDPINPDDIDNNL